MSLNNVSSLNNMKMKDSLFLDLKSCYILLMMIQILVVDIFFKKYLYEYQWILGHS